MCESFKAVIQKIRQTCAASEKIKIEARDSRAASASVIAESRHARAERQGVSAQVAVLVLAHPCPAYV